MYILQCWGALSCASPSPRYVHSGIVHVAFVCIDMDVPYGFFRCPFSNERPPYRCFLYTRTPHTCPSSSLCRHLQTRINNVMLPIVDNTSMSITTQSDLGVLHIYGGVSNISTNSCCTPATEQLSIYVHLLAATCTPYFGYTSSLSTRTPTTCPPPLYGHPENIHVYFECVDMYILQVSPKLGSKKCPDRRGQ